MTREEGGKTFSKPILHHKVCNPMQGQSHWDICTWNIVLPSRFAFFFFFFIGMWDCGVENKIRKIKPTDFTEPLSLLAILYVCVKVYQLLEFHGSWLQFAYSGFEDKSSVKHRLPFLQKIESPEPWQVKKIFAHAKNTNCKSSTCRLIKISPCHQQWCDVNKIWNVMKALCSYDKQQDNKECGSVQMPC